MANKTYIMISQIHKVLNKAYKMTRCFQSKAEQPTPAHPIALDEDRVQLRTKWMTGELQEFLEASNIYEQADALTDLLYYLMGTYVEMGIKPWPLYKIVHYSNMKKLKSSNGVVKDGNGKVQKPSGWKHPDEAIKKAVDHM